MLQFRKIRYTFFLLLVFLGYAYAYLDIQAPVSDVVQPDSSLKDSTTSDSTKIFPISKIGYQAYDDLHNAYPFDIKQPDNVQSVVEYDVRNGNYVFKTKVGDMEVTTPYLMSSQEYLDYTSQRDMGLYWKEKNSSAQTDNEQKFSLSDMKFNIGAADKVFGPGGVQIKTQGSTEIILGAKHNRIENPALNENQRSNVSPQFDMKIQLNVSGNVGDKVNFGMNYNTESSFDFDQKLVKLAYKGKEDDIIRNIQAGNVSMQLNSSLISGSTALFGVKTDLQFGKLSVSAVASQQESETKTVSSKGGAQKTKFELSADDYEENKHFFLSHYFRNRYESALKNLPTISSGYTINRVELWVTNKRAKYDQARNVIAFMDLGENERINNSHWSPNLSQVAPANNSNDLYSQITSLVDFRDIQQANNVIIDGIGSNVITGGEDFEKIESARKLDPTEYSLNTSLGYVSLKSALRPDEVLAVAFEYTYAGKVYQVGEFSTDAITAPDALLLKLLKGTTQSPQLSIWDLMMKNVYYLGSMDVEKDNFDLRVTYRNDSLGADIQYLTEGDVKNKLLLRVMNLDRLDPRNAANPDGKFDFLEGVTVNAEAGRVIFPVLEPFGSHLKSALNNPTIADKYVFTELYDSTLVVAQELSERNKFSIVGEYKSSSGSEIRLNAMNIPRGSVTVTAGGATLVENVDYTVDYTMGTVSILNQSIIESGTTVDVKLENQSTFSMQRKSLLGTHLEYQFNKDLSIGATVMHLSEVPLTTKVNTGNEPISNTVWGMNASWRGESQWLTNMLDKLPFVNAVKPSTIALNAEVAQLIPGHSRFIGKEGYAYLDDFEFTKTTIDLHYPTYWYLSSTPYNPEAGSLFPEASLNTVEYGKNRALLAWYYVDRTLNSLTPTKQTPINLRNNVESQSNHYTRDVLIKEVFPNKSLSLSEQSYLTVMNLSYYPQERGPYNLDFSNMDNKGLLLNPKSRWAGIMRKLDATDFETSNIEYLEFWMMDPFIYDTNKTDKGGDLYINLGDISEDILKDGKKSFEHGLPINGDVSQTEETVWGRVPKTQSSVTAFDNSEGARKYQDVGLDGLTNESEFLFPAYKDYVDGVKSKVDAVTLAQMTADSYSPINDPAGDKYQYFKGETLDQNEASVLVRYKRYNGTEGNSPDAVDTEDVYSSSATTYPDIEDVNADNTLNEYERYFQYKVSIRRDSMEVGKNHITNSYVSNVKLANGNVEPVTWYQFKIPVREYDEKIGSIRNFKSIRFIRMFMTDFEKETHLRFASLDLVRGEWRSYSKALNQIGTPTDNIGKLDVQAVNIEENSDKTPVNYILPPGVERERDPGQVAALAMNEQSMVLKVSDLAPNDARAVYRNTSFDMRQYKKIQMFVHAEKMLEDASTLNDYELSCFIRLGSDLVNNYYEYEIPLKLTEPGVYSAESDEDRNKVWLPENMFDFTFDVLTNAKLARNKSKQDGSYVSDFVPFYHNGRNKIRVVGNPSLSNVENIMIGIRNVSGKAERKSGEIWVNELRMSEFNEEGGTAAMGNVALGLSDIGNLNMSGRIETSGYGSIESNVLDRRNEDLLQLNLSSSVDLGRFFPEQAKLQIPAYFNYSKETLTPKYNPLDEDVVLKDVLETINNQEAKDSLLMMSQTMSVSKSFNISSAKVNIKSKKKRFYDPANLNVSYAYTETDQSNAELKSNLNKQIRGSLNYSYNFSNQPFEPFKNVKALDKPIFKIVKDFNLNYLPSALSYSNDMNRQFAMVELRDLDGGAGIEGLGLNFSKDFMWNRNFSVNYDMTRSLKFTLQTATNSNIAEPYFTPEIGKEYYEQWKDTVWYNIKKMGEAYAYQQVFTANWQLPINKIPLFDWIQSTATYNSTYSWDRTALVDELSIGNIANSQGAWSVDGQFNFETLYNKSKYLKSVNNKFRAQNSGKKFQAKTFKQTVQLVKDKKITIAHRLGSDLIDLKAIDKKGKIVPLKYKSLNTFVVEVEPLLNTDSVEVKIETLDPTAVSTVRKVADFSSRFLMMVRRASITYRSSNSMVLPGFTSGTGFLGQQKDISGASVPGYGFVFGLFDEGTLSNAVDNGWLYMDEDIVNPATIALTSDLDIKANIEPISGLKIDLSAKRYTSDNKVVQYMFDGMPQTFNGSYNVTQVAIATAFKRTGGVEENYSSEVYNQFLTNRQVISDRLNSQLSGTRYPTTGFFENGNPAAGQTYSSANGMYGLNSSDVLIPAFLAAYTGRDPRKVSTNPFLSILEVLPNWRLNFDGLSRIPWISERFKSVSITHAYTSKYSVANYTSYSTWVSDTENTGIGYIRDVQTGNPIPSSPYDISAVSLTEQFSPLIGINTAMKNSITTKLEYKKQRNLALNISSAQLIEASNNEFVIGFGYVLKDFDVIIKLKNNEQSKVKNDLKLSADLSYKDIKTLLRKIDENITQASSGNKMFTLKLLADYVFSSKVNIQLFFDRQMTTPLVSTTYPVSSSNFGISFKFMLTR